MPTQYDVIRDTGHRTLEVNFHSGYQIRCSLGGNLQIGDGTREIACIERADIPLLLELLEQSGYKQNMTDRKDWNL